jgi:adhesin HecA-like repeat protein
MTTTGFTSESRNITAGSLVVGFFKAETSSIEIGQTVTDTAGGTWTVVRSWFGSVNSHILYSFNHPGGTGVVISGTFTGGTVVTSETEIRFAEFDGTIGETDPILQTVTSGGSNLQLSHTHTVPTDGFTLAVQGSYYGVSFTLTSPATLLAYAYNTMNVSIQLSTGASVVHAGGGGVGQQANISVTVDAVASGGSGDQTLTASLLTNSNSFYSPAVTGGAPPTTQAVSGLSYSGTGRAATLSSVDFPGIAECTWIWWEKQRTSGPYYAGGFILSRADGTFVGSDNYIMPVLHGTDGTFNTTTGQRLALASSPMYHEIATDGADYIASPTGLLQAGETQQSYPAQYDVWVKRVCQAKVVGANLEIANYVDFDNPLKVIRQSWPSSSISGIAKAFHIGQVPWATEECNADIFGIGVYSRYLSPAEIESEFYNFTNTPNVSDCWFRNVFPTLSSGVMADLKGFGTDHPFTLRDATTPGTFSDTVDIPSSILPGTLTNTQTFYTATISQTAPGQTLTAGLLTNSQTFYSPTVGRGAVNLTPGLLTNSQTFYSPTVGRGAVNLTPGLFSNAQTFYAATFSQTILGQALTVPLLTNGQTFYSPTVSAGPVALSAPLVSSFQTFYSATVVASGTLGAPLLTNGQTFYGPIITTGAVVLTAPLVTNSQGFYVATVTGGVVITPLGGFHLPTIRRRRR